MAVAKMKKFTFLTFRSYREQLLRELQRFGEVHLKDLQQTDLEELDFLKQDYSLQEITRSEGDLEKVRFALSKLSPHAEKEKMTARRPTLAYEEFDQYLESCDFRGICDAVKAEDDRISAIGSEMSRLRTENEGLKVWTGLDIAPSQLEELSSVKALVGTVNKVAADALREGLEKEFESVYMETLGAIKEDMAVLLLVPQEELEAVFSLAKDLGFSRANLSFSQPPRELIHHNEGRIGELEEERRRAQEAIKSHRTEFQQLQIVQDCLNTILERERACQSLLRSESVILMEGWFPLEEEEALLDIVEQVCGEEYYMERQDVERDNTEVPIKLKNNRVVAAFESITAMYSLPRYNEFDPTPLLAPFYWFFFGLMVGDAGYGLLMLVGTLFALKFMDLKPGLKGMVSLFFYLSFGVILGGLIYSSFFGFSFFEPIPVMDPATGRQLLDSVTQAPVFKPIVSTDDDIIMMIVLSVALGVIHVMFGLAVKGVWHVRRREFAAAIFDSFFWIAAVLSGIGLILGMIGMIPDTAGSVCTWIFVGSLIGLAATQGRESPSLGGKIGNGLYGVYGISSYIGDLVSYTRIAALALSGAYIAFSFNMMGWEIVPPGWPRVIFGTIVVILGQTLNIGLALLGAYVHTCRLQYVEFFGKFYEGGGVRFSPLNLKNDYIHIKK